MKALHSGHQQRLAGLRQDVSSEELLWSCSCWRALPEEAPLKHLGGWAAADELAGIPQRLAEGRCQGGARELRSHHRTAARSFSASSHMLAYSPSGADGGGKLSASDMDQTGCLPKKPDFTLFREGHSCPMPCVTLYSSPHKRLLVHQADFTPFKESCSHLFLQ